MAFLFSIKTLAPKKRTVNFDESGYARINSFNINKIQPLCNQNTVQSDFNNHFYQPVEKTETDIRY